MAIRSTLEIIETMDLGSSLNVLSLSSISQRYPSPVVMLLVPQVALLLLNALLIHSSPTFKKQHKNTFHHHGSGGGSNPSKITGPTVTLQNGATVVGTDLGQINGYDVASFAGQ